MIVSRDGGKFDGSCICTEVCNGDANARLIAAAPRMYDALRAIDGMKITEETDKAKVLAICMAIAKIELENIEGRK